MQGSPIPCYGVSGLLSLFHPFLSPCPSHKAPFPEPKCSPSFSAPNIAPKKLLPVKGPQDVVDIEAVGMWTKDILAQQVPLCPQLPRAKAWLPPALPHGLQTGQGWLPQSSWPLLLSDGGQDLANPGGPQRAPPQSQVDCTPEMAQAESIQIPLGTSRGKACQKAQKRKGCSGCIQTQSNKSHHPTSQPGMLSSVATMCSPVDQAKQHGEWEVGLLCPIGQSKVSLLCRP